MQKVGLISEQEMKALRQIHDVLLSTRFSLSDIRDDIKEVQSGEPMTYRDMDDLAQNIHHDLSKLCQQIEQAEHVLSDILHDHYDHDRRNLDDFELGK